MSTRYPIKTSDINSSYLRAELANIGVGNARWLAEGGEGESRISVYAYPGAGGIECRVAVTNGEPVWENEDEGEFAELLESVGIAPVSYNAHEAAWQLKITPDALRRKARRTGIGRREGQQWSFTPADIEALRSRESDRRYKTP